MSMSRPSFTFQPLGADDRGFAPVAPSVGASGRASLGRGIAFVLLLTAASVAWVYGPRARHGADWVEGTAPGSLSAYR